MVIVMNKKNDNDRKSPLRMTRQRRVILEELRKVTSHPTADAVYGMVRKRLANISLGTVYRNLEILSKSGMIQKLELCGPARRYDGNPKMHYHLHCVRCEEVLDVPIGSISAINRAIKNMKGYEILGYRLEFEGVCEKCKGGGRKTPTKKESR